MNKLPGKIKISYSLEEIFERPLNIPKRPLIGNIGILYNYGPGVRGTNAQCLPSRNWEHSDFCHDFSAPYHRKWLENANFLNIHQIKKWEYEMSDLDDLTKFLTFDPFPRFFDQKDHHSKIVIKVLKRSAFMFKKCFEDK